MRVTLTPLDAGGMEQAQRTVVAHHYLHARVDQRCMPEGYAVRLAGRDVGVLLLGRPESTRCYRPADAQIRACWAEAHAWYRAERRHCPSPLLRRRLRRQLRKETRARISRLPGWYGSVEDVHSGRVDCTRWQVLNLARVWFDPAVQPGGSMWPIATQPPYGCTHAERREWYAAQAARCHIPGYFDRTGVFRSTLATCAIRQLLQQVSADYLERRPPCYLEEPYALRWLLSYCDTRLHKGTIYRAAGAELYRTNEDGIQTYRWPLGPLAADADARIRTASDLHPRSRRIRERRDQFGLALEAA